MARLQLTRLSLQRPTDGGAFVGDPCGNPDCRDDRGKRGVLGVYSVKRFPGVTMRYLSCNVCGWKPDDNKMTSVEPLENTDLPGQKLLFDGEE